MHITPEKNMIDLEIQDMTCGHCREAISRDAIAAAGYTPTRMTKQDERPASRAGGCSCSGAGASCGMRLGDFLAAPGATPRRPDRQAETDARPVTGGRCCSAGDAICSA